MLNTQAFILSALFDILYQLQGRYSIKSLRMYAFPTTMAEELNPVSQH